MHSVRSVALAAAAIFATSVSATAQTYDARVGTSSASSSHAVFYATMGALMNEYVPDSRWTIVNTGGIADNHALLERGQIDALADSSNESYDHYNGLGPYEGRPKKDLRTLFYRTPAPQNIIVRADADINSIEDLNGKPFNAGSRGTTTETLTIKIFEALGIKPDYFHGSLEDAVSAFQDGRIVGLNKASPGLSPDATYQRLSLQSDIKGLSFTPEQIAKIHETLPSIRFIDVPANTALPGSEGVTSILLPLVLTTTTAMPDEIAYNVIKTIDEHLDEVAQVYAGVKGVDIVQDTLKYATVPLHAGVVRYIKEKGVDIPKDLIPEEAM